MKTNTSTVLSILVLLACLPACTSEKPVAPDGTSYVGAWAYAMDRSGDGVRVYDRLGTSAGASFELRADGRLSFRHCAYVGGDFPTCVNCEGLWYEDGDGVLAFSYSYAGELILKRLTVLYIDAYEMRCRE